VLEPFWLRLRTGWIYGAVLAYGAAVGARYAAESPGDRASWRG
jgi:hypothetical protein